MLITNIEIKDIIFDRNSKKEKVIHFFNKESKIIFQLVLNKQEFNLIKNKFKELM